MSSHILPLQRTKFTRNEDIKKEWILVDAKDEILGRIASRIAYRLMGKHRPDYAPHQDTGDYVVVINAGQIAVTGNKLEAKKYYKHSNHPGGIKSFTLRQKLEIDPAYALRKAVQRMLPKGALGRKILDHVKIYPGAEHQHHSQKPVSIKLS
jgi:large subunit ribosomal protein L13